MTARKRDDDGKFIKGAETPEWERLPWTQSLIQDWTAFPAFQVYCKENGLEFMTQPASPLQTSKATSIPEDLTDLVAVIAQAIQTVNNQQALPSVQPRSRGTEMIEFPDPYVAEATAPSGEKVEIKMPLYPINIAGEDYSGSGYYDPKVTERLKEEMVGAEYVKIPYNAAFLTYTFQRTNEQGKIERIQEMFRGPGVFAGKTLAASIKKQLKTLVEYTLPGGYSDPLIPGTKTQYNDLMTNEVLFVPGFTYLLPPHVAEDIARRVKEHAESFQRVHQERQSLGRQGLSIYSGVQLQADEAVQRAGAGMQPNQIDKVVQEGRV